ncbi:hypothetical protein ACFQPC_02140 [Herminiimonas glaciei]|uniref:Uncharacterized protein n=1 Tax=Herminiimonas glaciei TaxID=523788 RepID=A0ABW2I767_9BURK
MDIPVKKYFALAVLVMFAFVTNVGLWSDDHFNWLTHELEHSVNVVPDTATADFVLLHQTELADGTEASNSIAVEHELLHAASHLQLFLGINAQFAFLPAEKSAGSCFHLALSPCASPDAPFRPPRFSPVLS